MYTSPLRRCLRTGQIIAEPLRLAAQAMDALNDIDYGEWQGLTPDEVRARWPDDSISGTADRIWSRSRAASRSSTCWRAWRTALRAVVELHPEETVVLVGHDSVNRVMLLHALELPLSRYWLLARTPCPSNEMIATGEDFLVRSDACHLDTS